MIVADTSAILAIVFAEPERERFLQSIRAAQTTLISTVSIVEARMVIHARRGQRAVLLADDLLRLPLFQAVPPGPAEVETAYSAFVAFGKGTGHPAGLNFGDVFSYALAKTRNLPLLFKGEDFALTDLEPAV